MELSPPFFSENGWSSFCLSSLAAQNICASKFHNTWTHLENNSLSCSICSTSSCSLLNALTLEESIQALATAVRNPNKAVFTVDVRTTEVIISFCKVLPYTQLHTVNVYVEDPWVAKPVVVVQHILQ